MKGVVRVGGAWDGFDDAGGAEGGAGGGCTGGEGGGAVDAGLRPAQPAATNAAKNKTISEIAGRGRAWFPRGHSLTTNTVFF
jgi:hypothetical protein